MGGGIFQKSLIDQDRVFGIFIALEVVKQKFA